MSNSVTIVVTDAALATDAPQTLTYLFDTANTKDLQQHISDTLGLPRNFDAVIKWKTKDLDDKTMVTTMNPMTFLISGEIYFASIDTWADIATPSLSKTIARESTKATVHVTEMATDDLQGSLERKSYDDQEKQLVTKAVAEENQMPLASQNQPSSSTQDTSDTLINLTLVERMLIPRIILPCPLLRGNATTQGTYLANLYIANQGLMDDRFKEMSPSEKTMVETIDVIAFISNPSTIAALVFLHDESLTTFNLSLLTMARKFAKKAITDIISEAYKKTEIPGNALEPLISLMLQMTGNAWFSTLLVHGCPSPVVMAVKKRQVRHALKAGESPKIKKQKLTLANMVPLDIDEAAGAISEAQTPGEMEQLVANTSQFRCQWLNEMDQDITRRHRRIETMVSKFSCFVRNATLLRHDFKYTMENMKGLSAFNVGEALHLYAPAIVTLGKKKGIFLEDVHQGLENDMLQVCKTLIDLVPTYCKRNKNCKPDRLIVEGKEFTSVQAMADVRKDMGQKAGMILVFNRSQGRSYYVCIDDQNFKVTGDFSDALQRMVEIHYIFDAEYAPELENFHIVLEHLAGLEITGMKGNRADLYFDILFHHREIQGRRSIATTKASPMINGTPNQSNGTPSSTQA